MRTFATNTTFVRPGMFLPVRATRKELSPVLGDRVDVVNDLAPDLTQRVLLDHRRQLGLLDNDAYFGLIQGQETLSGVAQPGSCGQDTSRWRPLPYPTMRCLFEASSARKN